MVPRPYHGDSRPFSLGWLPVAAFGFMGAGLGCGYSRRRRFLLFVGCALAGLIFLAACGGGPKSVPYAITITGRLDRHNIPRVRRSQFTDQQRCVGIRKRPARERFNNRVWQATAPGPMPVVES